MKENILQNNKLNNLNNNTYEEFGVLQPFTALDSEQFRTFVANLVEDTKLVDEQKEAFDTLWNCACIDIGDTGNNIWNLREGTFEIFNKNNTKVHFKKKSSDKIDKIKKNGRADFVYSSPLGGFIIHQHEKNQNIFLVYVSEKISLELLTILKRAEIKTLELEENIENDYNEKLETNNLNVELSTKGR